MTLKTVDLPAPLGPISARISPFADLEADPAQRVEAAEADREILDTEQRPSRT